MRSTYSTVGEKKRDCRRQRGAEPTTIRSLPRRLASPTIASPIERARIGLDLHLDAVVGAEQARLGERGRGRLLLLVELGLERLVERHADHVQRLDVRAAVAASLTAVAIISSPIAPSFIGTRMLENSALGQARWAARSTCSSRPSPRPLRTSP